MMADTDILIIGGGPAGFTAAMYAARAGLDTVVMTPAKLSGMMARAPKVENFPGQVEPAPGREILAKIRQQALNAGAEESLEDAVGVDFSADELTVYGGAGMHTARAVIIATGAMARGEKVPGEEQLQGRGVSYCAACDGPLYQDEKVLVVGDDARAVEEALTLAEIAEQTVLVTPSSSLDVDEKLQAQAESRENLAIQRGLKLQEIRGEDFVESAVFENSDDGDTHIEATGIFLYLHGWSPATDFLQGAVETDDEGAIITSELGETDVMGVFAAGDVSAGDVAQMVTAAGEGCRAALAAERFVRHGSQIRRDLAGG
jgi:thioredoxin reductase (NADPH)